MGGTIGQNFDTPGCVGASIAVKEAISRILTQSREKETNKSNVIIRSPILTIFML